MTFDIGDAASLLGRTETREALLHAEPARLLQATLDRDDRAFAEGDSMPLLWHWLYFPRATRQSRLGDNGHTHDSDLLTVIPALPHRMWAGSRLRSEKPLRVGDRVMRRSTVTSLEPKIGKSGGLLFVTLHRELAGSSGGAGSEDQFIVFRAPHDPNAPQSMPSPAPKPAQFERTVVPMPPLLFGFSALTFNGHRIHYDYPYATEVEGYEGLVVHGPLIAVLMLDLAERAWVDRRVLGLEFKAPRPAIVPHRWR